MQHFSKEDIKKLEEYLGVQQGAQIYEKNLWKKVYFWLPFLRCIPGILCICVGNSLSMNACHTDSDIDLFIISKEKRMWTVRILTTLLCALLGIRKTQKKHAGRFCLSFFISESAMDFSHFAEKNDIYLAYWIERLVPILNRNECYERFLEKNQWYKMPAMKERNKMKGYKREAFSFFSAFGDIQEFLLKKIFLQKTQKSFQKLGEPYGVIISDTILKFHDKDKRKIISQSLLK